MTKRSKDIKEPTLKSLIAKYENGEIEGITKLNIIDPELPEGGRHIRISDAATKPESKKYLSMTVETIGDTYNLDVDKQ